MQRLSKPPGVLRAIKARSHSSRWLYKSTEVKLHKAEIIKTMKM